VDVAPFLERRLDTFRVAAMEKEIALSLSVAPGCTVFHAERDYMRTIVDNLLSNAIKFTPEGGRVSVAAAIIAASDSPDDTALREVSRMALNGRCIEIKVTDTGVGISTENLARLFQPFVQIDGKFMRKAGGAGLGLALVRSLVECHGGTVDAESAVGEGSTFRLRLPWRDQEDVVAKS
jgi:signal transduction histidine kinase